MEHNEELGTLVALAEAATPGEWKIGTFGQLNVQDGKYMLYDRDAEYIRATQPAAILRIAALVAQQAARIEELTDKCAISIKHAATIRRAAGLAKSCGEVNLSAGLLMILEQTSLSEGK